MPKDGKRYIASKDDKHEKPNSDSLEYDHDHRRRERRRKESKKTSRRRDESDSDGRRYHSNRRDKKTHKHKKSSKSKRTKDRTRYKVYDDDSSSYDSRRDDDSESEYSRRRRHKRSRKERKRRRKEKNRDGYDRKKARGFTDDAGTEQKPSVSATGNAIAKTLHILLSDKPDFASELPLILIRLAGGTTFDLRQVTDPSIANGLQAIFRALETFGVKKAESSGMWMFQTPPGATRRDELVLLRVVRSFLNDIGLTIQEVENFDAQQCRHAKKPQSAVESDESILEQEEGQKMKRLTLKILERFCLKDATLGSQLASLCMTIVDGESVSVDGIPDEDLKVALESLFQACGLEKSEIEMDDDDDDDDDDEEDDDKSPLMGYGLPGVSDTSNDAIQLKLASIMAACREGPPKRKSIGPMRRPETKEEEQTANEIYEPNNGDYNVVEEEDDGPLLPGEARGNRSHPMSEDMIEAQAKYRELEFKSASMGVPMPMNNGGREEWMINPGKHDFLSGIKSGQAIKSRGFQNKKSRGEKEAPPVHPAVQAEMDAIMQAHENARGPSLMDLHQSKKAQEKELASNNQHGKKKWNWTRNKDLDAGRRVDKDALGMIMGGAAENLKTKFAGGFNG
eukprot:CAMPEP_0197176930 /NCGR_PEP_ID=MMETSP1423-20130617/2704_1 /TAXON_ID=476441 /ORGANISM="Pseudo-nitzschia heimii, Strain UNC1101" /LENGTH=623 /DNA_ID=CAMNT_0042626387 /DNA_START=248 /DNA_END=2119 /DNA_ORIENTATION=+